MGLSGGCRIDDNVILGGMSGLHQFVHIGRRVMVGGYCKVNQDIPPFVIVDGPPMKIYGLNAVGLQRAGFTPELRGHLKQAFRLLVHDKGNLANAIAQTPRDAAGAAGNRRVRELHRALWPRRAPPRPKFANNSCARN